MSRVQDKEKYPSPQYTGQDALTTELWRPHGKLPHVQARFICMTCDLHTASISNANKHHVHVW